MLVHPNFRAVGILRCTHLDLLLLDLHLRLEFFNLDLELVLLLLKFLVEFLERLFRLGLEL